MSPELCTSASRHAVTRPPNTVVASTRALLVPPDARVLWRGRAEVALGSEFV